MREIRQGLSHFSLKDQLITERQMQRRTFQSALVAGVAARCRWGVPQALLCRPFYKGRPFPTLFWLTCPHLSYLCGTLESRGGVQALEEYLRRTSSQYRLYNAKYAIARLATLKEIERKFLRRYNPRIWDVLRATGIGGIRLASGPTVKCLHLQTATCLALHGHPARQWLMERFDGFCCKNAQCVSRAF